MTTSKMQIANDQEQLASTPFASYPMQIAPCPLCGANRTELYCEAPDRFHPEAPWYAIQRCLQCGMIYLNPQPPAEDSGRFYEHADYLPFASLQQNHSLLNQIYGFLRRANLRWKRRVITDFLKKAKAHLPLTALHLLDVGCGTGEFLAIMRAAGWQVEGIERDERAAAWARQHYEIPVSTGSVEQLAASTQQYDVIAMWHVLEHLYDPGKALATIFGRLRDDGWLLIAVPNINGIDARLYKANWVALDAPRHLNHFSLETLARLGSKHGLTLRWWRQLPLDSFFNTVMSEKLAAQRQRGKWFFWPLRLIRALLVAFFSLIGGSHTPFSYAAYGASLVCFFEKSHRQ